MSDFTSFTTYALSQVLRRQEITGEGTELVEEPVEDACGIQEIDRLGFRVGALFIILATSLIGTLFPVIAKRVPVLRRHVPGVVFEFAKFFGSGIILATGFIHLLEPATDALGEGNTIEGGGCISNGWSEYPYAFGICLTSIFVTFVVEMVAFRLGNKQLKKLGISTDSHNHGDDSGHAHGHTGDGADALTKETASDEKEQDTESVDSGFKDSSELLPAGAQILGVAMLEFGVIFHSITIGLTLALTGADEFNILFIVIIFHQMFEGLGLGSRLAFLQLPTGWNWIPFFGAILYAFITPLGMAIGLGARSSISMSSGNASIAAGVLDAISAGVLIFTALVELIAHEFLFNKTYHDCSWGKLIFALTSFLAGAVIMALLGKWA